MNKKKRIQRNEKMPNKKKTIGKKFNSILLAAEAQK